MLLSCRGWMRIFFFFSSLLSCRRRQFHCRLPGHISLPCRCHMLAAPAYFPFLRGASGEEEFVQSPLPQPFQAMECYKACQCCFRVKPATMPACFQASTHPPHTPTFQSCHALSGMPSCPALPIIILPLISKSNYQTKCLPTTMEWNA